MLGQRGDRQRGGRAGEPLQGAGRGDRTHRDSQRAADLRSQDGERVGLERVRHREQAERNDGVVAQAVLLHHAADARSVVVTRDSEPRSRLVTQRVAGPLDVGDGSSVVDELGHDRPTLGMRKSSCQALSPMRCPLVSISTTVTVWCWTLFLSPRTLGI